MDASTRRTRFEERVRIERDFLVPVNRRFGKMVPLAGMTTGAIESWRRRAEIQKLDVDVEGVAVLLLEAAARAELLADNSRDVFETGRHVKSDGLSAIKDMLDAVLEIRDATSTRPLSVVDA